MDAVFEYAGFVIAHYVEKLSQGEAVIPMLSLEREDGNRESIKLPEPLQAGLAQGTRWLASNPDGISHAVLVFPGSVTVADEDCDAIICKAVQFQPEPLACKLAIPYRSKDSDEGLAIFRVKILEYDGPEPDYDAIMSALFRGVETNEAGADAWFAHIDQSK